jgi:2,3-bisphosphoglycerate-dependent phosphoglycerate mutase
MDGVVKMTTIYFVRHAEAVSRFFEPTSLRPLTEKGWQDRKLVTEYLRDKQIDVVLSSSYKRTIDTVSDFAEMLGVEIELIWDFRERTKGTMIEEYMQYAAKQWADFSYKMSDGESLAETQERNIKALGIVLQKHSGKNIVIGTHGQALGTIINYFDKTFDFEKKRMILNPFVVKMTFDGSSFVDYEMINILT